MDSRASANSVCIPLKSALPEAEVIAGYGAKCARTFSACRQCVSKAEKGPDSAGPFRRGGVWKKKKERGPRWGETARGPEKENGTPANSPVPKQKKGNSTRWKKTPRIR